MLPLHATKQDIVNMLLGAAGVAVVANCAVSLKTANQHYTENREQAKEYVQQADSAKYNQIISSPEYKEMSGFKKALFWPKKAREIQDSLRIDSIAKEAYAKGLIAVKDSMNVNQ